MIVHGPTVRVGIGGRAGRIEQDQDPEMAFEFAAFEVDVFWRGEPRPQIDAQRDQCVDIHVVTVGPTQTPSTVHEVQIKTTTLAVIGTVRTCAERTG